MSYQVLARKWRPRNFAEVLGQGHVLKALVNALDGDRLHHAYLFTGTRGVGKTTLARVFAKSLNCELGVSSTPCGTCSACRELDEGRFVDLIEVDAATRTKVDETRELLDNVQYAPTRARYKVYLIDEVHMFSNHSFNALLKTLEEPPPHVKFLLATTDPKRLPVTILSRCLQFNLTRLSAAQLARHLATILDAEGIAYDVPALQLIAQAAGGSVRDSLSLLDQAIAHGGGRVDVAEAAIMLGTVDQERVFKLLSAIALGDASGVVARARDLSTYVPDYAQVLAEVLSLLRRIAVVHALGAEADTVEDEPLVFDLAGQIAADECQLFYQIALTGRRDLAISPDPEAGFEMILLRMLAFRPADASGDTLATRKVLAATTARPAASPERPSLASRPPPQAQTTVSAAATAVAPQMTVPPGAPLLRIVEPAPALSASEVSSTPDVIAAMPSVVAANPLAWQPGQTLDWSRIVDESGLTGLARELARNSALASFDGALLKLVVAPQYERLAAQRLVETLQNALVAALACPLRVTVTVAQGDGLTTPSEQQLAAAAARQRRAETEIGSDPNVLALQHAFGATIEDVSSR